MTLSATVTLSLSELGKIIPADCAIATVKDSDRALVKVWVVAKLSATVTDSASGLAKVWTALWTIATVVDSVKEFTKTITEDALSANDILSLTDPASTSPPDILSAGVTDSLYVTGRVKLASRESATVVGSLNEDAKAINAD